MEGEATPDDDRAIQVLGLLHAERVMGKIKSSPAANPKARVKLEIAGLERGAELLAKMTERW